LHYNPRHVSSNNMLIFRKSNCIVTASGIVTLLKQTFSAPVESGLLETCRGLQCNIYYYRINILCFKLVIETSLHYDAQSEKHQRRSFVFRVYKSYLWTFGRSNWVRLRASARQFRKYRGEKRYKSGQCILYYKMCSGLFIFILNLFHTPKWWKSIRVHISVKTML